MTDEPPTNMAAWLKTAGAKPLEVGPAPYTRPAKGQLVVRNHAWSAQIVDLGTQSFAKFAFPWITYPHVAGCDVAGEVAEVGEGVTRFRVGDRVCALAAGGDKRSTGAPEGAFQLYTVVRDSLCSPLPDAVTYPEGAAVPLGLSTAACGMFMRDFCALAHPTYPPTAPRGQVFVVWGGSTSVGCNAIQMAVAAGYEVVTTASPKNFDLVRRLGAAHVFDYRSKTVKKDIIACIGGRPCAGAIAIGKFSLVPCMEIVGAAPSATGRKFVAQASVDIDMPETMGLNMIGLVLGMAVTSVSLWFKKRTTGVDFKFVFGSDLIENEVGDAVFRDYLPGAFANGSFVSAPEPLIVGKGLGAIQDSFDVVRKGVSAKKVIITAE